MNLRPFPRGTWYSDALPDGRFVVLHRGSHLETERGRVELPSGQNLLYVYLHTDGRFCGVGHQPPVQDRALVYEPLTGHYSDHGVAVGPNGVIFDAVGNVHVNDGRSHATGWRYVADDGSLVWNDDTYADPARRIWEYTTHGDVVIGQGGEGPYGDDPCLVLYGGKRYLLSEGRCRAIRFHRSGNQLSVAFSREDSEACVCVWLTVADIPTLRELVDAPPIPKPDPPPLPKPEPVPMPTVEQAVAEFRNFRDVVARHRTKVSQSEWSRDRAPYVMRDALIEYGRGGGLLLKPRGDNAHGFSADNVVFPWQGIYWTFDVFKSVETTGEPTFGTTAKAGTPADGKLGPDEIKNYVLAANVKLPQLGGQPKPTPAPQPTPEPEPVPEPTPTPTPQPVCDCDVKIAALTSALELLSTRVRLLETSPLPKLKVSGGTSKDWGHAHEVTLMVEKA